MDDRPENRKTDTLLEFPCQFPIKIMGRDNADFRRIAVSLVEKHVGEVDHGTIKTAPSSNGNFLSVTITIDAQSQDQLDNIYRDLSGHEAVLVAL